MWETSSTATASLNLALLNSNAAAVPLPPRGRLFAVSLDGRLNKTDALYKAFPAGEGGPQRSEFSPRYEVKKREAIAVDEVYHTDALLAERESNQIGFDGQICPILSSFPLDILPICPAGKAFGIEKICCVKTVRTRRRMHF